MVALCLLGPASSAAAVAMTCNPGVGGCLVHGSSAQAPGRGIMDYASLCFIINFPSTVP